METLFLLLGTTASLLTIVSVCIYLRGVFEEVHKTKEKEKSSKTENPRIPDGNTLWRIQRLVEEESARLSAASVQWGTTNIQVSSTLKFEIDELQYAKYWLDHHIQKK